MPTVSVENYLKAILYLHEEGKEKVSTTELSERVAATPASTSAMLKKLGQRGWVEHQRYHGVQLTESGHRIAMDILRRHRLWESFLVEHLGFDWDQVHDIAEELEHVDSVELTSRSVAAWLRPLLLTSTAYTARMLEVRRRLASETM